jgi:hypothetical protein
MLFTKYPEVQIKAAVSPLNRVSVRTKRVYRENPDAYKGKTPVVFCSFVR